MKFREELLYLKKGFGSASGNIYIKPIYLIALDKKILDEKWWEITYSPSLGASHEDIKKTLKLMEMGVYQDINIVVKRHLEWIAWLRKNLDKYTLSDQIFMKGLQFGLTEEKKEIDSTVDFLRVKAKINVPNWVLNLPSIPKKIIIDYNGSGISESIINDVTILLNKFPNTQIYLEQPIQNMNNLKRIKNVRYIFDTSNLLSYDIKDTDIVVFKFGRNTPEEYVQLRKGNKNLYFGNLTSGEVGERICFKTSNKLSTLNLLVI